MYLNTLSPSQFIDNLKCSICQNYLSHFPIHVTKSRQNVCGRCSVPKENIHMRNDVYEVIAKQIEFPCRYTNEGCLRTLSPKDVPNHERVCPYRIVECPTAKFTKCVAKISYPILAQHCKEHHHDAILSNGEFEVDLLKSSESSHLVLHNGCFFVFRRKFDLNTNKLQYSFACVESEHNLMSYFYEVVLTKEGRSFSVKGFVGNGVHEGDTNKVNLDLFVSNSYYEDTIAGKILLDKEEAKSVRNVSTGEKWLALLKCSSCSKIMKPGDNILWINNKTTRCSSCGPPYGYSALTVTDSFGIWDLISEEVYYPCEYQTNGCDFTSRFASLEDHEASCAFKNCTCPLSEYETCNWSGLLQDVIDHITENHSTKIIHASAISENVAEDFAKCYIMAFATKFFRLSFHVTSDGCYWAVQRVGVDKDALKFQVQVLDNDNNDKILVARQFCVPLTTKNDVFRDVNKYCYFKWDQAEPLLRSDNMTFAVNIFK